MHAAASGITPQTGKQKTESSHVQQHALAGADHAAATNIAITTTRVSVLIGEPFNQSPLAWQSILRFTAALPAH